MFSSVPEAVVADPPHIVDVICGLSAFRGFAVVFDDDFAFT